MTSISATDGNLRETVMLDRHAVMLKKGWSLGSSNQKAQGAPADRISIA